MPDDRLLDENFQLQHTGEGILSTGTIDASAKGSHFSFCMMKMPFMDGKHVVFGQVTKGYAVVKSIESVGSPSGTPSHAVVVTDCGAISSGEI
eukprot:gnl/TRDRNA2_/TRDRNA2_152155_c0_seq1.p1 gnl/TRDRNA2_/TRDRNA2_152155_c0~~gnl/TRDRNA2_/TRDRNA2_152155_c0_seq1.p1  ORF type:complete len:108 (-),score=14.17 gnl/TRDRNA2_/TRDRNA2_152155_c0_seq1:246-524(-)